MKSGEQRGLPDLTTLAFEDRLALLRTKRGWERHRNQGSAHPLGLHSALRAGVPSLPGDFRQEDKTQRPATETVAERCFDRERATGLEPATSSLGSWHSTN